MEIILYIAIAIIIFMAGYVFCALFSLNGKQDDRHEINRLRKELIEANDIIDGFCKVKAETLRENNVDELDEQSEIKAGKIWQSEDK